MKKIIALALAFAMLFSFSALAFAADPHVLTKESDTKWTCSCGASFEKEADANNHIKEVNSKSVVKVCPYCQNQFVDEKAYNEHIVICASQHPSDHVADGVDILAVVDRLIKVFEINANWWDAIEDVIIRIFDFVENIGSLLERKADVAGAVADLEFKVDALNLPGNILETVKVLISELKQKIKDFYAGAIETSVDITEAEAPAETGSASTGIAVFAAVSALAAAAYVCTKKREDR